MGKVLITGITGFAGSHLAERLAGRAEVWGTRAHSSLENLAGIQGIKVVDCDLLDYGRTLEVVSDIRPSYVYHLAAQSAPSISIQRPEETIRVNVFTTLNLLEAVVRATPDAVVLNVGSADEYGDGEGERLPLTEEAGLRPLNPYALSKVTADLMGFQYWRSRGLRVVRCRPFNHIGPRQSEHFVASSFAKQIAEIECGINAEKVLKTGRVESSKDFLDVRDVVAAYETLMEKGEHGRVYNICSGRSVRISDILDTLLSLSAEDIRVEQDPSRLRSADSKSICGDPSRIKALGWEPRYDIRESLRDMLDYWRGRLEAGGAG